MRGLAVSGSWARKRRAACGLVRLAGAGTLTALVAALVLAGACLPDLEAFPPAPDALDETGTIALASAACGDGIIDTRDDGGDAGESCDPGEAGVAGCDHCQFTCGGRIDDAGHCYFLDRPTSAYNDAVRACAGASGHVVTLSSEREAAFATSIAGDAGYWVGLSVRGDLGGYGTPSGLEPGWPREGDRCPGCFALGADDAGQFIDHPADVDASDHSCLVSENGSWLRVSCDPSRQAHMTLCEREPIGQRIYPCGGLLCTTIPATIGSKRYVVWQFVATAEEARNLCETSYVGGSLVMFDTHEEREQLVREIIQRLQPDPSRALEVWIGLSNVDGLWTWDDGMIANGTNRPLPWGNDQPSLATGRAFLRIDSTTFDTQLARSDEDTGSGARHVFVCQRPLE